MEEGKLSWDLLQKIVLQKGSIGEGVIQGPKAGCDVAVFDFHKAKKKAQKFYESTEEVYVVYKSDPITFPTPNPGQYCVEVNANDIVTSGALPYGFNITIILPTNSPKELILKIQQEINEECSRKGITVLGGHTEISSSVNTPIISGAMIGFVPIDYYVPRKMKEGDILVCVGWCAKEGIGIIAEEGYDLLIEKMGNEKLDKLIDLGKDISIVDLALSINKKYKPGLMHDATEGGILGAAYETIIVENFGLELESKLFPFTKESMELFILLDIDPLRVISSGTLLVVLPEKKAQELIKEDSAKIPIRIIGKITNKEQGVTLNGKPVEPPSSDAIIDALRKIEEGKL